MAPRANWKGYLKLSLVSCPIAIYPATSASERVSFRQVNKSTGNRLKQQLVDAGTGEPVEADEKGRGYEIGKNQYLIVEDEELEAIQVESSRTIEIERFVPREQIDLGYLDSPYYIVPDDAVGQEAFAVIREAMRGKDMVALGRIVMAKRERPIMLEAFGKGLRGVTLRYPYEVRGEDAYFGDIADVSISKEMLELAEHILKSKAGDFDPSQFEDRYEQALVELLRQKQAGIAPQLPASAPEPARVINLMEALRRSVGQQPTGGQKTAKPAKQAGKRTQAKEEALRKQPQFKLPIAGGKKKQAEEVAKPAARSTARPAAARKRA
jgi:DNA end-binding protein Ku